MSLLKFDASKHEPAKALEPVPTDWYPVMITESEFKPTKGNDGTSKRLNLTFTIIDGPFKGRKVFDGLNLANKNPVAEQIAQGQLSAICHAISVIKVNDSQELHGKPFMARIRLKAADGQYDAKNEFAGAKAMEGGGPIPATTVPVAAAPAWAKPATAAPAAPVAPAKPAVAAPKPPAPAKPAKPTPPAPKKEERDFFIYKDEDSQAIKESELQAMVNAGEGDYPVLLAGTDEWKTAADFGITPQAAPAQEAAPAAAPASTASAVPPWKRK